METLLINPPAENIIRESLPPVVEDSTGVFPPLGLLYVAAYAEEVEGYNVNILDCQAEGVGHANLESAVSPFHPDVVGIQAMTFTMIDAILLARRLKSLFPEAIIVFGGPHPTLFPAETIRLKEVDVVVIGEGEYTFQALLKALQNGSPLDAMRGIITNEKAAVCPELTEIKHIQDLDNLKQPAYHLIKLDRYYSSMSSQKKIMTMMSSRGCPFKCNFCDRPQMGKRFRKKSAQKVFGEMQYCVEKLGVGEIFFYDDTFSVDKKRVLELCDLIIANDLKVEWDIRARIDTMTPEMIHRLKQAGCVRIHYGVETGSPRLQKSISKNLNLEKAREVFRQSRMAGIETLGYFMIGLPSETRAELQQTLDFMTDVPMDYAHIGILTPYPGTAIYKEALANGVYETDYWREFSLNPQSGFTPKYWTENFSEQELLSTLKKAYAMFYRRPSYLLRRLLKVRSFSELWTKSLLGIKLLWSVSRNR